MPKSLLSLAIAGAMTFSHATFGADEKTEPTDIYNYMVGYQVTAQIVRKLEGDGVTVNPEAFQAGLEDALKQAKPRFTQDEVIAAIQSIQTMQADKDNAVAKENYEKGQAFLAENAKKEGVTVTESGLQYIVSEAGDGESPAANSNVLVHYRGTLINGEEFDSSYARGQPARFSPGGVIPGFREALLAMKPGAKWRVFIPSELAYGERGPGGKIGPNETLIFDLELLEVSKGG